jgi:hypothetical protein
MFGIVFIGLVLVVTATVVIFAMMFVNVAFAGPDKTIGSPAGSNVGGSRGTKPAIQALAPTMATLSSHEAVVRTASPAMAGRQLQSAAGRSTVNRRLIFSRDTRHLRILMLFLVGGGVGALFLHSQMVPEGFGDTGPYRAAALAEIASQPSILLSDAVCLKCHTDVQEERAESPHQAVSCLHCHGNGAEHVAAAVRAAESPDYPIPAAQEWDGDFLTHTDLFITQDRATCLSCHTSVVGMPDSFRSINVAEHLEEQGAEEINSRNVCFECHEGHSPGL